MILIYTRAGSYGHIGWVDAQKKSLNDVVVVVDI